MRLEGGLGNQLFQYAAGRALASRHGVPLLIDDSPLRRPRRSTTARALELQHFGHVAAVVASREVLWVPVLRRAPSLTCWFGRWQIFLEQSPTYDAAFATLPDETYLIGYWQNPRYFNEAQGLLRQEIQPIEPLSSKSLEVQIAIEASQSVSIHVRRGDYATLSSAAALHGTLPLSYYEAAISRIRLSVRRPSFFIFSDEPTWAASNLSLRPGEATFVSHNAGPASWQDLVLMGKCRHHIIANSSFSWWGAWMADQHSDLENRVVLAPTRWFAGRESTLERFPAHWTALG